MKLSRIKEIGEFVSMIAIVATLLFLIVEVRENTAAIRTASYSDSITRLNDWRMQQALSPELSLLYANYLSGMPLALDQAERQQLLFVLATQWTIYDTAYFAQEYGTLGQAEWARFQNLTCPQYALMNNQQLWEAIGNLISPEFKSFVESQCN